MTLNKKLLLGIVLLLGVVGLVVFLLVGTSGDSSSDGGGSSVAIWVAAMTPIWIAVGGQ